MPEQPGRYQAQFEDEDYDPPVPHDDGSGFWFGVLMIAGAVDLLLLAGAFELGRWWR